MILSSGQPSLNPRLVKEADALTDAGHEVTVLYAYWNDWGTEMDNGLLPGKKWKAVRVGGHPRTERFTWFMSRLIYKAANIFTKRLGSRYFLNPAIARSSFFLIRSARRYRADMYIGHNLGALPATVISAKMHNRPCGFDAEDFHRGEASNSPDDKDVILKTNIENKYLPQLSCLTAGSPLIAAEYHKLFPDLRAVSILNVFPIALFTEPSPKGTGKRIKLFWFSQTVGPGRGLDNVIDALKLTTDSFELHLLGHVKGDFKNLLSKTNKNIFFYEPIPPGQIPAFASRFDIGLAAEASVPHNRDICLTNKIFTYMQAGLAILASDTTAQQALLSDNPGIGKSYNKSDARSLASALSHYDQNRDLLADACKASLKLAHEKFNWELESKKFMKVISNTLSV